MPELPSPRLIRGLSCMIKPDQYLRCMVDHFYTDIQIRTPPAPPPYSKMLAGILFFVRAGFVGDWAIDFDFRFGRCGPFLRPCKSHGSSLLRPCARALQGITGSWTCFPRARGSTTQGLRPNSPVPESVFRALGPRTR